MLFNEKEKLTVQGTIMRQDCVTKYIIMEYVNKYFFLEICTRNLNVIISGTVEESWVEVAIGNFFICFTLHSEFL